MKRACLPCDVISQESRLCVLRLAHLITVIFSCEISTRTSVLHLGAVQWEVANYSIFENSCSGFVATDGA